MATTSCHSVVLLGDWGVGKSSLLNAHMTGEPQSKGICSTIGMSFSTIRVATAQTKKPICCWDTAGQERYRALIPMYTRNASAYICVIASSRRPAVEAVAEPVLSIIKNDHAPELCHIAIVHSKCDLGFDIIPEISSLVERIKEVLAETGKNVNISVHESSSLKPSTCHSMFEACIRSIDEKVLSRSEESDVRLLNDKPASPLERPKRSHRCCW